MKRIYMSLSISFYSRGLAPDCRFYEMIDDKEMTVRKLTLAEAQKLQWELVKAGATRTYRSNMFNNAMSDVDVDYWMWH